MSLSFVLPAFNEAENIERAVRRCTAVGEDLGFAFEIIVVDDGSRDGTRRLVDAIAAADPRVRSLHHPRNIGYGGALKTGLLAARMQRVFFTDADLQFDVAELIEVLHFAETHDIVAGYRAPRRDPLLRVLNGWIWSRLVGAIFDLDVRDVDCAFKVFDRHIFDRIEVQSIGAFVNTEILVRARAEGFTMIEVPVGHYPRTAGQQSGANPRVVIKAFRELYALASELRALPAPRGPSAAADRGRGAVLDPGPT